MSIEKLKQEISLFAKKRNWQKYHSPKNISMALTVEACELQEIFQWLTQAESHDPDEETRAHIEEEIGDVMIYLTQLAACFNLDPIASAHKKMEKNRAKYPL